MRPYLRSVGHITGALVVAALRPIVVRTLAPCWCGRVHRKSYWHDPTHGAIDRDLQDHARRIMDYPEGHDRTSTERAKEHAIGLSLQSKRDRHEL